MLVRTCQKQQDDKSRCKFFLWDTDAHPREATALANNSRTEPAITNPKTPSKRPASPPPPYTIGSANDEAGRKRSRARSIDPENEYGFQNNSEAFKSESNHVLEANETPRKAARKSELETPPTRRMLPWSRDNQSASIPDGLQTPQTSHTTDADSSSAGLRNSLLIPPRSHDNATSGSSACETPTPSRFKNVERDDLVQDILTLLLDAEVRISKTTERDLQAVVSRHTKAAEGLKRGRDVARSTIKARDAKITELSYRISTLEAELEAEKVLFKHLQWQVQTGDHTDL